LCACSNFSNQIEQWPLNRLIPYARNPRTHSDNQIAQIAGSIAELGFTNPILVDSKDGIIAGHGRLLGARKLGLASVPVIVLDHLTETQKRAYIIADNKLALNAGWDDELLGLELIELKEADFDLDVLGFNPKELDDLLTGVDDEKADIIPPVPEQAMSRTGDVWRNAPPAPGIVWRRYQRGGRGAPVGRTQAVPHGHGPPMESSSTQNGVVERV
jgi:ParB-like chromosome segregation protein Spo0J